MPPGVDVDPGQAGAAARGRDHAAVKVLDVLRVDVVALIVFLPVGQGERSVHHPLPGQPLREYELDGLVGIVAVRKVCAVIGGEISCRAAVDVIAGDGFDARDIIVGLGIQGARGVSADRPGVVGTLLVDQFDAAGEVGKDFPLEGQVELVQARALVLGIELVADGEAGGVVRVEVAVPEPVVRVFGILEFIGVPIETVELAGLDNAVLRPAVSVLPDDVDLGPCYGVDEAGQAESVLGAVAGRRELDQVLAVSGDVIDQAESR